MMASWTRMAIVCPILTLILTLPPFGGVSALNLTILHTNDCHARFVETDQNGRVCNEELRRNGECYGGVARRATVVGEVRSRPGERGQNVLLLDAGDQFQGTDWFYVYRGNATAHFMNLIGYDVMVLGNHEFDNGIDGLLPFLRNVSFPVLSCNMDASNEPRLQGLYVCSHVFDVGGDRVGVVGYILQTTPDFAKTGELTFTEVIPAVQEAVDQLVANGVNKIIALGHTGFAVDQEVARSIVGIDIVIGGHTNTFLYSGDPPSNQVPAGEYPFIVHPDHNTEASVLVLQAYAYGKYLGYLDVSFSESGVVTEYSGNPILLDNTIQPDPDTQAEVEAWKVRVDEVSNTVIGRTVTPLDGSLQTCGSQECNLGNMMADAMLANHGMGWDDVSIAMTTAGSIASSLDEGNITIGELIQILPYGNTIDRVRLLGKHLLQLLEVPMADPQDPYRFIQASGLYVEYDLTRPSGDRVYRARFRCTTCTDDGTNQLLDIDPESMYSIIMNSYMAGGGGGYDVVKENKIEQINGLNDVDVTSAYVQSNSPLDVAIEGRIILYDEINRPSSGHVHKPITVLVVALLCAFSLCFL